MDFSSGHDIDETLSPTPERIQPSSPSPSPLCQEREGTGGKERERERVREKMERERYRSGGGWGKNSLFEFCGKSPTRTNV